MYICGILDMYKMHVVQICVWSAVMYVASECSDVCGVQ